MGFIDVVLEVNLLGEAARAQRTLERSLSGVRQDMAFDVRWCYAEEVAEAALISSSPFVG